MDILFASKRFRKQCNDYSLLVRRQGLLRAKRIKQRLDDLRAATTLKDMCTLPGRCHELKGNRAGQLSLDLDYPYRLIFEPAHNPIPCKEDGGIDWPKVTAVRILGVEDTHE